MKKQFTFLLLAAALLVSVPSWGVNYVEGTQVTFEELGMPLVEPDQHGAHFGTICVPQRIVATQGINIYEVKCVDVDPLDTTQVARLVIADHVACHGQDQGTQDPITYEYILMGSDEPFCYWDHSKDNNDPCDGKTYIDWIDINTGYDYEHDHNYPALDHRMVAGGAYFYDVCDEGADSLADRKIWVDKNDSAAAPVCRRGFYGTFENTYIAEPIVVLSQDKDGLQYLEKAKQVTMPAKRGYFKGNFECVPWRYNTTSPNFTKEFQEAHGVTGTINPLHDYCNGKIIYDDVLIAAPQRLVAFNVGRDAATGLYQVDFEHPIYLGKETNKRIENGQLIIEAADGSKYNAFGQRVQ